MSPDGLVDPQMTFSSCIFTPTFLDKAFLKQTGCLSIFGWSKDDQTDSANAAVLASALSLDYIRSAGWQMTQLVTRVSTELWGGDTVATRQFCVSHSQGFQKSKGARKPLTLVARPSFMFAAWGREISAYSSSPLHVFSLCACRQGPRVDSFIFNKPKAKF